MAPGTELVLRKHLHRKESYQLEYMGKASENQSHSQTHLVLPVPKETKISKETKIFRDKDIQNNKSSSPPRKGSSSVPCIVCK